MNATAAVTPATATAAVSTSGSVRLLLRVEGAITLLAAVALYRQLGGAWSTFAWWFLVPDVSMVGYLAGPRVGAAVYNLGHSLLLPGALAAIGVLTSVPAALLAACIWVAHVGFDRMAGYGLKAPTSFFDTHLGRVGKGRAA